MGANAILSFFLEIAALAVYGWAPFSYLTTVNTAARSAIGAALILVVIVVWSRYAAPRATNRLSGWHLATLKAVVFIPATTMLGIKLGYVALLAGLVIVCGNLMVEYVENSKPVQ